MKILLSLLAIMTISTACQRQDHAAAENFAEAKTLKNVPYGNDSLQTMDIYLPAGRHTNTTKAIVLIHGGGWASGSKSDFALFIDTFKKRLPGYALFNIDYRLVNGKHLFPAQEKDVHAAVDQIIQKADEYGFNKENLVLMGASAGAHLALLEAYKYNRTEVKAVIDYFGPTDLVAMYENPWHQLVPTALQMITGTTPEVDPAIYIQSSPVNFVDGSTPPTLILHGTKDNVVHISQSQLLQQALERARAPHEFAVFNGEGHGWWRQPALSTSFDRVEAFLKKHVQ